MVTSNLAVVQALIAAYKQKLLTNIIRNFQFSCPRFFISDGSICRSQGFEPLIGLSILTVELLNGQNYT